MRFAFKKKNAACVFASLILASLLPLQANAHRTWLLPSATQLEGKEPWVTFDAAVSENLFDFDTNAFKLEGLEITGPDGQPVAAENQFAGRLRSNFDVKLSKPGTYKVGITAESIMASYKVNGEPKRWRGPKSAFEKAVPANAEELQKTDIHNRLETYVSLAKPNNAVLKATGVGLEVLPVTHPNDLQAGHKASFQVLLNGQPVPKLVLAVVPGGVRYRGILREIRGVTNEKGEFSVTLPEAGMYWIGASYPSRNDDDEAPVKPANADAPKAPATPPAMPQQRYSYSGTFEVLP
jgi:uncharacterized GH25 family protein